ncbi:MFS transporter [Mitsuaria sp. 7]|uniref:MFS transporter n=1 Tax=Mitsuaria sp. 7 TaxID=1658665 RepID=UPI0009EF2B1D
MNASTPSPNSRSAPDPVVGPSPEGVAPSAAMILLLAVSTGLGVSCLYFSQPILVELASDLGATAHQIGMVPMLTQLGYALGLLLLTPLGDRFDRRRVILAKFAALILTLLVFPLITGYGPFLVASAVLGLTATLAQDVVPMAAALSGVAQRGRVVGKVMTGLLLGILLSRVASGLVAQTLNWRWVYGMAAGALALAFAASWRWLPSVPPARRTTYGALIRSLADLWRHQPALRRAASAQALLAVAFSAFWSTLAIMLHERFAMGTFGAGAFGLVGAAGALAAPLAGIVSDRRGPALVTKVGAALTALAFVAMTAMPWLSTPMALAVLVITAVVFDFGVQAVLVAHQTIVYGLDPAARSRLNALLFTTMFLGMAAGAALGSAVFAMAGWTGVAVLGAIASGGALLIRLGR